MPTRILSAADMLGEGGDLLLRTTENRRAPRVAAGLRPGRDLTECRYGPTLIGADLASCGANSIFLMLGVVPLFALVVLSAFGIETRERVLEEIAL